MVDGSWRKRKAASRDRRAEARGTEAYLRKYVEGLSDEPVGLAHLDAAKLVAAADLRLQQNRQALLKRVILANTIAANGKASPNANCAMSK